MSSYDWDRACPVYGEYVQEPPADGLEEGLPDAEPDCFEVSRNLRLGRVARTVGWTVAGLTVVTGGFLLGARLSETANPGTAEPTLVFPDNDYPAVDTSAYATEVIPKGRIVKVPESIVRDCSVDVAGPLNEFVDAQPDGTSPADMTIIEFPAGACYALDGRVPPGVNPNQPQTDFPLGPWNGLVVSGKHYFALRSESAHSPAELRFTGEAPRYPTEKSRPINRFLIGLNNVSNVYVGGLRLTGQHSGGYKINGEYDRGVAVMGGSAVTLRSLEINDVQGDAVQLLPKGPWNRFGQPVGPDGKVMPDKPLNVPTGVYMSDLYIENPGRQAVAINTADGVVIKNSKFFNLPYHAVNVEGHYPVAPMRNIAITNNTFAGPLKYTYLSLTPQSKSPAVKSGGVSNVLFEGNLSVAENTTNGYPAVYAGKPQANVAKAATISQLIVRGNTLTTPAQGVELYNVKGAVVEKNAFTTRYANVLTFPSDTNGVFGVVVAKQGVSDLTMSDNSMTDNGPKRAATDPNASRIGSRATTLIPTGMLVTLEKLDYPLGPISVDSIILGSGQRYWPPLPPASDK